MERGSNFFETNFRFFAKFVKTGEKQMCKECGRAHCPPRCPNAAAPIPAERCISCGGGIFVDDYYYETPDGEAVCENCIDTMTVGELIDLIGGMKIAEAHDEW